MNVLIAMSGGVDSSAAAGLLQRQGYHCLGATMRLWDCFGADPEQSIGDAQAVAERLQIPFHIFDGTAAFRSEVVEPFISDYEHGLTPNPCIRCNQRLKFSWLLEQAFHLGCDYIATGHYARLIRQPDGRVLLYAAPDKAKDQSYFLAGLSQYQLQHTLFPLGELTKEQTRTVAQEMGFVNARKKDSQDICFIPDGDYRSFMERYTGKKYPEGDFIDENGRKLGTHNGAVGYTLGQRKGLGLAMGTPVYVCGKDMAANTVTVGAEHMLFSSVLHARSCNFIAFDSLTQPLRVTAKARSRHIPQNATVYPEEDGFRVEFDAPQRALTPGQSVVLYDGDIVLASGTIV